MTNLDKYIFINEDTNEEYLALQWNGYNYEEIREVIDKAGKSIHLDNFLVGYFRLVDEYKNNGLYINTTSKKGEINRYVWVVKNIETNDILVYADKDFRKTFYKKPYKTKIDEPAKEKKCIFKYLFGKK